MEGKTCRSRTHRLKTATAAADPVLARLTCERQTMVLLASDINHDRAGHILLQGVRFVRTSGGIRDWFAGRAGGTTERVTIKTSGKERIGIVPHQPYVRVADNARGFRIINLSRQEFIRYHLLSDRRLLRSGSKLERVPTATAAERLLSSAIRLPWMVRNFFAARLLAATA
jgi:hypothetical protein